MKHRGLTLRSAPESKDALRKGGGKWGTRDRQLARFSMLTGKRQTGDMALTIAGGKGA
jgi:hypothetical protein